MESKFELQPGMLVKHNSKALNLGVGVVIRVYPKTVYNIHGKGQTWIKADVIFGKKVQPYLINHLTPLEIGCELPPAQPPAPDDEDPPYVEPTPKFTKGQIVLVDGVPQKIVAIDDYSFREIGYGFRIKGFADTQWYMESELTPDDPPTPEQPAAVEPETPRLPERHISYNAMAKALSAQGWSFIDELKSNKTMNISEWRKGDTKLTVNFFYRKGGITWRAEIIEPDAPESPTQPAAITAPVKVLHDAQMEAVELVHSVPVDEDLEDTRIRFFGRMFFSGRLKDTALLRRIVITRYNQYWFEATLVNPPDGFNLREAMRPARFTVNLYSDNRNTMAYTGKPHRQTARFKFPKFARARELHPGQAFYDGDFYCVVTHLTDAYGGPDIHYHRFKPGGMANQYDKVSNHCSALGLVELAGR